MEAERRLIRPRKPLSDCTNTDSRTRPSSESSSSAPSVVKTPEPYPSFPLNNPVSKCKSGIRTRSSNISTNHHNASNPSHLLPPVVSTPSRPLNSSSLPGTIDRDDSEPISVVYSRRHTSDKRDCNYASNPRLRPPSILSTPFQLPRASSISVAGSSDHDISMPTSIVYSPRHASNKRKRKEKEVAMPFTSTPVTKILRNRKKSNEVEGVDLPKAKALTVPCKKKQRTMSSKQDVSKHALPIDFIEKQQAYFKEIDKFELPVEEVESVDELD